VLRAQQGVHVYVSPFVADDLPAAEQALTPVAEAGAGRWCAVECARAFLGARVAPIPDAGIGRAGLATPLRSIFARLAESD
jgi:hypothetical protein